MDYYSGAPEPNDYDDNNYSYNGGGKKGGISSYSTLILWILAIVIIGLIVIFFLVDGGGKKPKYNTKDDDSSLSSLEVIGGTMEPDFDSEVTRYTVTAYSDEVSFRCEAFSDEAKVKGCGTKDYVEALEEKEVEYKIEVEAEDGSITNYYFTIVKEELDFVIE